MQIEIKIPNPGESISEVELSNWLVNDDDIVEKDQEIAEIESEKALISLAAEESGKISISGEPGDVIPVGAVIGYIDTDFKPEKKVATEKKPEKTDKKPDVVEEKKTEPAKDHPIPKTDTGKVKVTPVAKEMMQEYNLSVDDIINGLKRISKKEVEIVNRGGTLPEKTKSVIDGSREVEENKMTMLRRKLSERLVAVKNETAMLTTFNEADMSEVLSIREKYQSQFIEKHGIKLGLMSIFTKAVTVALSNFPNVNSKIEGDQIITHKYCDIGIAVQTPKGLMVPVIRNAENKGLAQIELKIKELADKTRNYKISIEELTGGTFSISNGGVFGSMLSTPILNPPQSGILGMHNIVKRPVVINDKIEIRPVMYLAFTYDHRVIDGKDSVGFLVLIKELIESPYKMLFNGGDPEKILLEL